MTLLIALFARWGLSQRLAKVAAYVVAGILIAALLWAAWAIWLRQHDKGVIERHEEKITNQVGAVSSEAAASASAAVDRSLNKTELENDEARAAASGSADPLGDGLRSLRQGKGSPGPAAR